MPIIDYHSHLRRNYQTKQYYKKDYLRDMDENAIDIRLVSTQEGKSISLLNQEIQSFVQENPSRLLACASINPKEDDALEEMQRVAASGCFKAVELDSLEHGYLPEICPNIDEIFEICRDSGLIVNCFTGWGDRTAPMQWGYYAKRHPEVPVVMLHMGGYDYGYNCVEVAKKFPNVYVETSDVYELPIMHIALREIPHDRILFGSQYPDKITRCSIEFLDMFDLTQEDRDMFYWKNAARLLKIEDPKRL